MHDKNYCRNNEKGTIAWRMSPHMNLIVAYYSKILFFNNKPMPYY